MVLVYVGKSRVDSKPIYQVIKQGELSQMLSLAQHQVEVAGCIGAAHYHQWPAGLRRSSSVVGMPSVFGQMPEHLTQDEVNAGLARVCKPKDSSWWGAAGSR